MRFFADNIPAQAKSYLSAVMAAGALVLAYSFNASLRSSILSWLILGALTLVVGCLRVAIPYLKAKAQSITVTPTDIFVFIAILLYSPEVAACVAFLDACVGSAKIKKRYRIAFNVTQLPLVAFTVGHLFYLMQGQAAPLLSASVDAESIVPLLVRIAFCAFLYFLLNSGLIAAAMALTTRNNFREIWRQNFLWATPTHFAGTSASAMVILNFNQIQLYSLAVALPLVIVSYQVYQARYRVIAGVGPR